MLCFPPVWKTIHLNTASTSSQLLLHLKKKPRKGFCVWSFQFLFQYSLCGLRLQNAPAIWHVPLPPRPKQSPSVSWIPVTSELVLLLCLHLHTLYSQHRCILDVSCGIISQIVSFLCSNLPTFSHLIPGGSESTQYSPRIHALHLPVPSSMSSPVVLLLRHSSSLPGYVANLKWLCDVCLIH